MRSINISKLPFRSFPWGAACAATKGPSLGVTAGSPHAGGTGAHSRSRGLGEGVIKSMCFPVCNQSSGTTWKRLIQFSAPCFLPPPHQQGQRGPSHPLRCHEDKFTVIWKPVENAPEKHERNTKWLQQQINCLKASWRKKLLGARLYL